MCSVTPTEPGPRTSALRGSGEWTHGEPRASLSQRLNSIQKTTHILLSGPKDLR